MRQAERCGVAALASLPYRRACLRRSRRAWLPCPCPRFPNLPRFQPGVSPGKKAALPSVTGRPWGTPAPGACQKPCEGPHPGPSPNSAPREPGAWRARREQAGRGGRIPAVSCRPKAPLPARAGRGFARGGGEPPAGTWGKALLAAPSPGCYTASGAGPVPAPGRPRSGSQG